jgi:serine/threonine protein kinase
MQMFDSLPDINVRPNTHTSTVRPSQIPSKAASYGSSPTVASPMKKALPMGPADALVKYKKVLSKYEQDEIKEYPTIYFVGPTARKINAAEGKGKNCGYDDDKSRYKCVKNDHIGYRYEVMKGLGKGSFGDVVKGYDHKTKTEVAIKIIRNERRFHKQAQSEVKILDMLKKQDKRDNHNVIHMKDYFNFRGHLCITFEMMACDLYAKLKKDGFKGFDQEKIKGYTKALVTSLRVLRRSRIIHCDLKPENILLKTEGGDQCKIIDFGSSCYDHQRIHTYIQSRFYRSPEVIMGLEYGVPIDMWSLGCILAELHSGQPMFPGHTEKEQLMYQMEVLGVPPVAVIQQGKRASTFFSASYEPLHLNDSKGRKRSPRTRSFEKAVGSKDPVFLDFIARCLTWDPAERMTPREAAHHEYVTGRAGAFPGNQEDIAQMVNQFADLSAGRKASAGSVHTRM